jgi:pimeloyl-ACP methyl ester carboxylesterase
MNQEIAYPVCATESASEPRVRLEEVLMQFEREAEFGHCHTGRYRCSYFAWGQGPPLVFVHGLADDARSFVLPISLLSKHFRCIAYDLPTGRDDEARVGSYRHGHFVEDLLALVDQLQLGETYLFGSSFGSTITLAALHAHPERFPRAVLQGGFARRPLAPAETLLASLARWWPGAMRHLPLREQALRFSHFSPFEDREATVWKYFVERSSIPALAVVSRRALILHGVDLCPLLPEIRQPILMVCGDRDPLVNRVCEAALMQGLPQVTRAEIQGCGHFPYYTHPELLAELIHRFLKPLPCQDEC